MNKKTPMASKPNTEADTADKSTAVSRRYWKWGIVYFVFFVLVSPAMPYALAASNGYVLPFLVEFQKSNLAWPVQAKNILIFHWTIQSLLSNVFLIVFAIVETFLHGTRTRFDIFSAFLFGALAVINFIVFLVLLTGIEFLYVTAAFSAFYVAFGFIGLWQVRRSEPEMRASFFYPLSFVDCPTLLVCIAFIAPMHFSDFDYPAGFTDGIGAAILIFSGCTWTATMALLVGKTVES